MAPKVPSLSSLDPTATEAAMATDGAPGISSLKMRTPLGSTVLQIRDASAVKSHESKRLSFNDYSLAGSSSTTGDSESFPRSSVLVISTRIFWPTDKMSSTFSTRLPPEIFFSSET